MQLSELLRTSPPTIESIRTNLEQLKSPLIGLTVACPESQCWSKGKTTVILMHLFKFHEWPLSRIILWVEDGETSFKQKEGS